MSMGDHGAEARGLALLDLVPGVVGQARVEHARHLGVAGQEVGDRAARCLVALHAHGEGLDAAQDQEGVEGRQDRPRRLLGEGEPSACSARDETRAPPIESLWPFRNLVVEWTTRSAPSSSGRWR